MLQTNVSVATDEPELIQFLKNWNIKNDPLDKSSSKIILLSEKGWKRIANGENELLQKLEQAINNGTSVILLDAGEKYLGQGYPKDKNDLGPLQGVATISNTPVKIVSFIWWN